MVHCAKMFCLILRCGGIDKKGRGGVEQTSPPLELLKRNLLDYSVSSMVIMLVLKSTDIM